MIKRKDKIVTLCKDKSVLHLGFVQHSNMYKQLIKQNNWLHSKIDNVASSLVGLDFLEDEVKYLEKKYGYACIVGDVTKLENIECEKKFDVIVCGELIEHLENPGLMLKGIKKFMHHDSILIITTPNPWSKSRLKLIKKQINEESWLNPEHTCWFSFQTLKQLLLRYNYVEVDYNFYHGEVEGDFDKPFNLRFLNLLRDFKNIVFKTPKINYSGLFFVAKL